MDLHVKRFQVRYQGNNYGPGSIIYSVPTNVAEKLIFESNGTIEALPQRDDIGNNNDVVPARDSDNIDASADDTNTSIGLPSLDPKKTVK